MRLTPSRRVAAVAATVVSLTALAACGGGGDDATGATSVPPDPTTTTSPTTAVPEPAPTPTLAQAPDPCELVTQAEAGALAQTPLEAGVTAGSETATCTYTGPADGPLAQVEVYVGPGAKKFLDIDRELDHDFTEVPGIGDEAHEEEFTFFFRNGTTWVGIRLVRLDDPEPYRIPLQDLARTANDRL